MPQFIFTYHGGNKPETPEEGQKRMKEWKAWAAKLGSALINPGASVSATKVLTKNGVSGGSPHPITGFSILEAENMKAALELLKHCPYFGYGGTLEVSEMMEVSL